MQILEGSQTGKDLFSQAHHRDSNYDHSREYFFISCFDFI